MIRRRVLITGRVQGVGFRAATVRAVKQCAVSTSLCGYVKNLSDGRVEAVFVGDEKEVLKMVAWCRHGPPSSHVTAIEVIEEPYEDIFDGFDVT